MSDAIRILDVMYSASSGTAAEKLYNKIRKFTDDGGFAIELINNTGSQTIKGTIVSASESVDNGFIVAPSSSDEPIGVVYDDGVQDGQLCRIIVGGIAKVLLKDSTSATRGNWVQVSDTAGRADATLTGPNPVTHWAELGHCIETVSGGTDVLATCVIHFN